MKFLKLIFCLLFIYFFITNLVCLNSFAETFDVTNFAELESVLTTSRSLLNEKHTIKIMGDILFDSSISEAINLELLGQSDIGNFNIILNGKTLTFNGIGKESKILDLNILANAVNSGIINNNQTLNIDNSKIIGKVARNIELIRNYSGTLNITDSTLSDNKASQNGAAISCIWNSNLYIKGSNILNNSGLNGGGIYFNNGVANIQSGKFLGNNASSYEGAIYVNGGNFQVKDSTLNNNTSNAGAGSLYINSNANMTLDNTKFNNNRVTSGSTGGAIWNKGELTIKNNSSFTNNSVLMGSGGAISNSGNLKITDTLFENNTSKQDGGAITDNGTSIISNSIFRNNKSLELYGGAITSVRNIDITKSIFENNSAKTFGGAITTFSGNANISDSTFTSNTAEGSLGGGVIINYRNNLNLKGDNLFQNNTSKTNGGAITATTDSVTNIESGKNFI